MVTKPQNYFQSFNVAPSTKVPVILSHKTETICLMLAWNFRLSWSRQPMINARRETIFDKASFREAARKTRCIVPVAGWYEWNRSGAVKQPYYHTRTDGRSFGLAGIYTETSFDGIAQTFAFALITQAANEWAAPVHHRMPFLLHPRDYEAWLTADTPAAEVRSLQAFDDGMFDVYPVSTDVNRVANNTAKCIERIHV